jgi:hypothetical protein
MKVDETAGRRDHVEHPGSASAAPWPYSWALWALEQLEAAAAVTTRAHG